MRARLLGLAPALARPVAAALAAQGFALAEGGAATEPPVDLLVFHTAEAGAARQALDAFAATVAVPQRVGRDLLAGAQALWLIPEGQAGTLAGVLHQAALAHAPKLRVNALHLGPARPAPAPNHAAWAAAQPRPARPSAAESLRLALEFLLQSAAVTGQVLHLETALCEG